MSASANCISVCPVVLAGCEGVTDGQETDCAMRCIMYIGVFWTWKGGAAGSQSRAVKKVSSSRYKLLKSRSSAVVKRARKRVSASVSSAAVHAKVLLLLLLPIFSALKRNLKAKLFDIAYSKHEHSVDSLCQYAPLIRSRHVAQYKCVLIDWLINYWSVYLLFYWLIATYEERSMSKVYILCKNIWVCCGCDVIVIYDAIDR